MPLADVPRAQIGIEVYERRKEGIFALQRPADQSAASDQAEERSISPGTRPHMHVLIMAVN
jgi:hypothetical protein